MTKVIDIIKCSDRINLLYTEVLDRMMHIFMERYDRGDYEEAERSKLHVKLNRVEVDYFEYECKFEKPNTSLMYIYEVTYDDS